MRIFCLSSTTASLIVSLFGVPCLLFSLQQPFCLATTPVPEKFFTNQLVDHLGEQGSDDSVWSQRYYTYNKYFGGPGSPIFLVFGGEGSIEPDVGIRYPFISGHLARDFQAYVLQPEHRFYGKSQPLMNHTHHGTLTSGQYDYEDEDPRLRLFTAEQALWDAMALLQHTQQELGCSPNRSSPHYCPVITVGGSYPGWLSAMARVVFPQFVDMAYSASAPMKFYAQQVNQYDYYNHVTKVAEKMIAGCSSAVRDVLLDVQKKIVNGVAKESDLGICPGTTPKYIDISTPDGLRFLADEVMMVVEYSFANDNMANYPPDNTTRLYQACQTFASEKSPFEKLQNFLIPRVGNASENCWNMTNQLPTGHDATITSGDWSGVGTGGDGESWDFQTCTLLIEAIGLSSNASMFPPRDWSMDWLDDHCQKRFGVKPDPYQLVRRWKFDNLVAANVTRILFTNGLNDGWSVGGIKTTLSESLIALNFPNGAHHSDLSGIGPTDQDTDDIKDGFHTIEAILGRWLQEVRHKSETEESSISPQ